MVMILQGIIGADAVGERDYFLSYLNNPWIINGIRILAIAAFAVFVIVYLKYRKK